MPCLPVLALRLPQEGTTGTHPPEEGPFPLLLTMEERSFEALSTWAWHSLYTTQA
jgi:hypothetical protein